MEQPQKKEMIRYKELFNVIGDALEKANASPTEAFMTVSVMSEALTHLRITQPEWFLKSSLREVLGKYED